MTSNDQLQENPDLFTHRIQNLFNSSPTNNNNNNNNGANKSDNIHDAVGKLLKF
jgi:hypothetical protein